MVNKYSDCRISQANLKYAYTQPTIPPTNPPTNQPSPPPPARPPARLPTHPPAQLQLLCGLLRLTARLATGTRVNLTSAMLKTRSKWCVRGCAAHPSNHCNHCNTANVGHQVLCATPFGGTLRWNPFHTCSADGIVLGCASGCGVRVCRLLTVPQLRGSLRHQRQNA